MTMLQIGDPAPWFIAPTSGNPAFNFSSVAGRHVVLSFFGSAREAATQQFLAQVRACDLFDGVRAAFCGVSNDPEDARAGRLAEQDPAIRFFHDFQGGLANRYGLLAKPAGDGRAALLRVSLLLDPRLRVLQILPMQDTARHGEALFRLLAALPAEPRSGPAPVLTVPRVFEPDFCRALIAFYERQGGKDSGFMQTDPATGRTVGVIDYAQKRRRDALVEDASLRAAIRGRIERRLVPEIRRAFQFEATRLERYIVACYDAQEGGYFRPHRDNTTKGTAHRRFAVTLNLNAEDYDGGDLRFPEFGAQTYRAPTGGAVVFSCSLLHEATPVTRGRRYCLLPFLYDEAAAKLREANLKYLEPEPARDVAATTRA